MPISLARIKLRVVLACVHSKNDSVQIFCDSVGKPSEFSWEQTMFGKVAACRVENFIIGSGYRVAFFMQGNCEVVHGGTAYCDKVYSHTSILMVVSSARQNIPKQALILPLLLKTFILIEKLF